MTHSLGGVGRGAFFALVLLLVPVGAAAQADDVESILADRIDRDAKSVGIVVGLIDDAGSRVISHGTLRRDGDRAPDGDTVFEIGSITKVFTSIVLADMAQRGELGLDDPIQKFLPASVQAPTRNDKQITLRHLATHTSGLPRLPDNMTPADPTNPYADYTVEQMHAFLSGHTLTREIGAAAVYSNLGVGLLGHILARHAGMDYEALVTSRILEPLGMHDTVITLTPEHRARLATGHDGGLEPAANWDVPTLAGAGALRSTPNDLLRFARANLGLGVTPLSAAINDTHRARTTFRGPNLDIGLGWLIQKGHGREIIWHNGGTGGYRSFIGFDKATRSAVVVLSNATHSIDDIGLHLLENRYPLAEPQPPQTEVEVDPAIFDAYVGRYQFTPQIFLTITRDGDRLFAQLTNQPRAEIFPSSETEFFLKVVDAQISFVREGDVVSHLVLHQGGIDQRAIRLEEGVEVADFGPGETVTVPVETLERYVGEYRLQPGFVITITRAGDQLMAQATGQPNVEIFASSETEFFYKVVDAQITFEVTSDGSVEGLVLHQGGQNLRAPKIE